MLELSDGWRLNVDSSLEWLFFRIASGKSREGQVPEFAEAVWSIAERHGIYRLVVEFDHASSLTSALVGQLVILHKRTHLADGVLRLCGLSEAHCRVFDSMRLTGRLPNYPDREAAVMGYRPRKPR